jgi:aliphatic sulfonates family ABC transporter substrate-binding protein
MMNRREILAASAATLGLVTLRPGLAGAADQPTELRIGYQRTSVLLVVKAQRLLETRFGAQKFAVKWLEFPFGPPLLEALGAGALDYGYTGDAPPIFAQAAHAALVYADAIPARGYGQGIVVPKQSSIKSIAELKGKKVGVAKGSSAHDLLVAALEAAHVDWKDVTPAYLAPADAAAAFSRGAIDAWSIWDPYLAIAELTAGGQQLPIDRDVSAQNSFFLANRDFANKYPQIVRGVNEEIEKAAHWADTHRDEVAALYSEASGVSLEAQKRSVARAEFAAGALTDKVIAEQQQVADRFYRLGLIPQKIKVSDIVWNRKAAS